MSLIKVCRRLGLGAIFQIWHSINLELPVKCSKSNSDFIFYENSNPVIMIWFWEQQVFVQVSFSINISECLARNFYPKPYLLLYNYVTKFNVSKFTVTKTRLHCYSGITRLVAVLVETKSVAKSRLHGIWFFFWFLQVHQNLARYEKWWEVRGN